MAKYLIAASYTATGSQGLIQEGGTGRRTTVTKAVEGAGGTIEAFYFAFGEDDVYVIVDVPDAITAAALSLAVNASGAVRLRTVPLMTCEDMDKAAKKSVGYRAPGA